MGWFSLGAPSGVPPLLPVEQSVPPFPGVYPKDTTNPNILLLLLLLLEGLLREVWNAQPWMLSLQNPGMVWLGKLSSSSQVSKEFWMWHSGDEVGTGHSWDSMALEGFSRILEFLLHLCDLGG